MLTAVFLQFQTTDAHSVAADSAAAHANDLFRSRLENQIALRHPLAQLAGRMPWADLEDALAPTLLSDPAGGGRPALPVRLMAGLLYLKHAYDLSDEEVCVRWLENPYWQFFTGEVVFQTALPWNPCSLMRWRQRLGDAGMEELLAQTIAAARSMKAVDARELSRVIVDTTAQEKAIAHPTDSRLLEVARRKLVLLSRRHAIKLRQTYEREAPGLAREAGQHAHARQFKHMRMVLRRQRKLLGRVIRDIGRQLDGVEDAAREQIQVWLERGDRIRSQRPKDTNKLYALHAPEVECIGKGKARQPYEFGVKVGIAVSARKDLVVGARSFRATRAMATRWQSNWSRPGSSAALSRQPRLPILAIAAGRSKAAASCTVVSRRR